MSKTFWRRITTVLAALALAGVTAPAAAWNADGHHLVGAIADRLLEGTLAGERTRRLLEGGTLGAAGVWSDCVRGVRNEAGRFRYQRDDRYTECRPFETPEGQHRMVDYVSRNWDNCQRAAGEDPCHGQYHYANIPLQRGGYRRGVTGTSDHDLIAALEAAVAVLRGRPSPAPFNLANAREALHVLVHSVGDLHQPIHIGSPYLDDGGRLLDPDKVPATAENHTRGSNRLRSSAGNLHAEWDKPPAALLSPGALGDLVAEARRVSATRGSVETWAVQWADESLRLSQQGFAHLRFGPRELDGTWRVIEQPRYAETRDRLQRQQLLRAGARLATVLQVALGD